MSLWILVPEPSAIREIPCSSPQIGSNPLSVYPAQSRAPRRIATRLRGSAPPHLRRKKDVTGRIAGATLLRPRRVGGAADCRHHRDARRAGGEEAARPVGSDAADRHTGEPREIARGTQPVDAHRWCGISLRWSGRSVRRRGSRPCQVEAPRQLAASAMFVTDHPMMKSGPAMARAASTGRSDWPTCTPSAPAARATSRRSFTRKQTPVPASRSRQLRCRVDEFACVVAR